MKFTLIINNRDILCMIWTAQSYGFLSRYSSPSMPTNLSWINMIDFRTRSVGEMLHARFCHCDQGAQLSHVLRYDSPEENTTNSEQANRSFSITRFSFMELQASFNFDIIYQKFRKMIC